MTMPGGGSDRQVNVTLNANADPYIRSITAANQATMKLGDTLKKIDDYMVKLTKRAGIGATAVGVGGLVSVFGDVKQASALQQSFSALAAQATQTGTNVGTISTQVQKLSTQIPVATQSLAAMATQIAALGVTGTNNIIKLTKQAEQLAAATNTAPGQLFTSLIQMNQSLGGSLQNLERYGSALTAIQQNMGVSASATLAMSNSIQAVGQKAGISEQNLLGIASAFVKVGADGTTGAQAFNQVVNAMTDAVSRNSDTMKTFANVMGITMGQFQALVQNNPTQAFVQFIQAITQQGTKASITLQALGLDSVRTQRVFAALTSGQANLASALAQSNQAFTQNTATASASAAAWDTLNSKIVELKNSAGNIKEALGAPLLSVFQPITEALTGLTKGVSGFIHFVNDAPWPIGDTITSLVTKAPALLVLGGAFVTLTAAVSKFAGAWRVMTGMVGVNAFRGFIDARRGGGPRDVQENLGGIGGRVGSLLYRSSYAMGRGGTQIGVNARRGIGSMIAGYPLMRARQQFNQSLDTLRHPLNPEARDASMTDPLSAYGMYQSAQRYGQNARQGLILRLRNPNASDFQHSIADRLEAGFGEFDDSAEGIRRRRFTYVENARNAAIRQQRAVNSTLGRRDLTDLVATTEAAQYYQRRGTLDGYQPTNFSRMSLGRLRKLGNVQANYVGEQAAGRAGTAFDASLSEEETAKMANPFAKLATKVKEIAGDLTKTTAAASKGVFATIQTMFAQAVQKMIALAQEAKAQLASLQGYATTGEMVNPITGKPPVPGAAPTAGKIDPAVVRQTARIQAEETAKVASALPDVKTLAAESVIGFPADARLLGIGPRRGPLSPNTAEGDLERGVPAGMEEGGTAGHVARARTMTRAVGRFVTGTAAPAVGEAASAVGKGLLGVAGAAKTAMGMLLSPQLIIGATLLGPALSRLVSSIVGAHSLLNSSTDYAGGATQQALGRQVLSPAQIAAQIQQQHSQGLTDSSSLFGQVQVKNAMNGSFSSQYSTQLAQIKAIQNSSLSASAKQTALQAFFQQQAIGDVNQNLGAPMDNAQKEQLAELAIAAFGGDTTRAAQLLGGSALSSINTAGGSNPNFYSGLINALPASTGDDRQNLIKALSGQAVTDYTDGGGNISGFLYSALQTQKNTGGYYRKSNGQPVYGGRAGTLPNGPFSQFGSQSTQDFIRGFVTNYNSQNPNAKVDLSSLSESSVQSFYTSLQGDAARGSEGAKNLIRAMNDAGLQFDKTGAVTAASFNKLRIAAESAASALSDKSQTGLDRATNSRVNTAFQAVTHGTKGTILDYLNTPDATDFTKNITQTLQQLSGASNQGVFDPKNAEALRSEAEALGQLKSQVAQGSQQWQQLDQLQQGVFQQLAQVPLMAGQGFTGQLAQQVSTMQDYVNGQFTSSTAGDFNTQLDQTTQMAEQGVTQLQQYYMQVKDAHIQMERAQQDHQTQMERMNRDYNRQVAESQYQFNVQQREALYQYNINNAEQLYQFNEQIRQMKYATSQALGPAGSMVQAQYTMGAQSALTGFSAQTNDLQRSLTAMDQLKKMGVSADVIRVFKLDDPTNFAQAERYLNDFISNPQLIGSFNDMVAKNLNISQAIASDPNNSQFADLQRQFDHTSQLAAQSFTHAGQVATESFTHSMEQAKMSYDIQMQDFQSDYNLQTQRSLADLARIGEETQLTWQDLVTWAQQSGIPAVEQLGQQLAQALNVITAANNAVNASLQTLPMTFSTTLSQISTSLQQFMNANPAVGRAFAQANGIAVGNATGGLAGNQQIVNSIATQWGWGSGAEWQALANIVQSESGWNNNAQNPSSTAYGMFQFLNSTWAGTGYGKTSDPTTQAEAGLTYIRNRYGDPIHAWNFHMANGWYKAGGVFNGPQVIGVGEAGPEAVVPLNSTGANFMAQTLRASIQMMGPNLTADVRRGLTAPHAAPLQSAMTFNHTDASTHYHGGITVQAQDPNEMGRKLAAQQRLKRLSQPVLTR